jgi:hypothetical protein
LPKEKMQVGDDRHLVIDGRRLSVSDRHFESVYSIDDSKDPMITAKTQEEWMRAFSYTTSRKPPYRGHVNDRTARELFHFPGSLAPLFPDGSASFQISTNHFMAMGDNTLNSKDSRDWGDFDQKNLIGRCWFVYWPFTDRFGWGYR